MGPSGFIPLNISRRNPKTLTKPFRKIYRVPQKDSDYPKYRYVTQITAFESPLTDLEQKGIQELFFYLRMVS